jgi:hypothetical protein
MSAHRPEPRYRVNFPVYLTWQAKDGSLRRALARCLNISASGAMVETDYPLEQYAGVIVESDRFGRIGHATIRYCARQMMKYNIGLMFTASLGLSDSVRRKVFEKAIEEVQPVP